MAETGRGQLFHLISKGNSRVFYKKDYYTNKKSCPDSNRNPESNSITPVSYTHLRAHETPEHLVCRLLLEKKKRINK